MKRFLSFLTAVCMLLGCAATASAGRAINDLAISISQDVDTAAVGTPVTITYEVTGGCEPYYVYASGRYYYDTKDSDDLNGGDLNKWFGIDIENSAAAKGTITIVPTEGTRMEVSIDVYDGNDESAYGYTYIEITGSAPAPAVSVTITPNGTLDNVKFGDTVSADYTVTASEELGYLSVYVDQFGPGNSYSDETAMTGTITDTIRTGTNRFDFDISLNTMNSDWSLFRYTKAFRADPTGSLGVAGWRKVGEYWYYGDDTGTPTTGWKNINGYWYYFGSTGVMSAEQTGYSYDDDGEETRQYLGEDGRMVANTWFKRGNDSWYYADPSGNLAEGWSNIGGLWYYFNSSNHMLTGWHRLGGTWYYLNQDSGVMETGWKQENGVWMYLNDDGSMAVNSWRQIGGSWFWFDATGAMATGWQQIGGSWYYFNASGAMLSGWQEIGGVWYYFDASGAMATGWRNLGNWFFFNASGAMATGWQQIGGAWYYFDANGAMATGTAAVDGRVCVFDGSGAWQYYAD